MSGTWKTREAALIEQELTARVARDLTLQEVSTIRAYATVTAQLDAVDRYLSEHGPALEVRDDKGIVRSVVEAPEQKASERLRQQQLDLAKRVTAICG